MEGWLCVVHFIVAACAGVTLLFIGFFNDEYESVWRLIIDAVVCIIIAGSFIFGIYKINKDPWVIPDDPFKTVRIVALNDNNMTNSRFYVRRGYVSEDLYYQYMKRSGSGFKAGKVKADKTTLYYADDDYRVECYEKTKKWLWFEASEYFYKIYIPEGSITEDYMVDLE